MERYGSWKNKYSFKTFFGNVKILFVLFVLLIMMALAGCSSAEEDGVLIESVPSPSGKSSIVCYDVGGGATVSYSTLCCYYISEDRTKKEIYTEDTNEDPKILWLDEETVRINYEELNVKTDTYVSYEDNRFGECCKSSDNKKLMKAMCSGSAEEVEEVLANGNVDLEHMPVKISTKFGFQDCRALAWIIDWSCRFQDYEGIFEHYGDEITDAQREEIARLLIKYGADVNSKGKGGMTYLMGTDYDSEFRKMLLDAGADVCAEDIWGDNIIDYDMGANTDDYDMRLMLNGLITYDQEDVEGYFTELEQHGLKLSVDNICTCLDKPESFNNDFLKYMIRKTGADQKSLGVTEAEYYAMTGDSDALLQCINKGFSKEKESDRLLWYAARNCNVDVLKALQKAGYDLMIKTGNDDQTLLHLAAKENTPEVIEYLIGQGLSVNAHTEWEEDTPLTVALVAGRQDIVKFLLKHGAKWNKNEGIYHSDWYHACVYGKEESIDILVALDYQPNNNEIGMGYCDSNDETFLSLIKNGVPYDIKYESYIGDEWGEISVIDALREYEPEKADYLENLGKE